MGSNTETTTKMLDLSRAPGLDAIHKEVLQLQGYKSEPRVYIKVIWLSVIPSDSDFISLEKEHKHRISESVTGTLVCIDE